MNATMMPARVDVPQVVWRPMAEPDLPAVAAIEAGAHRAPWSAGSFRDALAAGYGATIGTIDEALIAYGVLLLAPGEAQLLNLTVVSAVRRRGIGRALLHRFLADAQRLGAEQCFLEVRASNAPAIALYQAEGFAAVARRVGYYPPDPAIGESREDALVMRRALRDQAFGDGQS